MNAKEPAHGDTRWVAFIAVYVDPDVERPITHYGYVYNATERRWELDFSSGRIGSLSADQMARLEAGEEHVVRQEARVFPTQAEAAACCQGAKAFLNLLKRIAE